MSIKDLIKSADTYDTVSFNSHDIGFDKNGVEIYHNISSYYKQLLFKIYDGVKYNRNVHHELVGHLYKEIHASDDLYYEHIKKEFDIYIRGCRNFFIAGGGVDEYCDEWKELRAIKSCPSSWHKFRDQLISGTISNDIKNWITNHRNSNTLPHRDSEIRAFFTTYYEILHPEQNIDNLICEPEETVIIVNINQTFVEEEYLHILGRHGDPAGVKLYTDMLTDGKLTKDDVKFIFKNSQEYISKNPSKDITQAPFCSETELKVDIAEFTNTDIDIVNTHWTIGYEDTLKSWEEIKPNTNDEIEDWYSNTNAYIYDLAIFHHREINKNVSLYESITSPAIAFAHDKNLKVLDFGGGIGTLCFWLVKEGHDVSYYDLNSITSDFAKFRNIKHNMPIKFYSETNLPTDTYDFVTMIDVVEHLVDIPKTLGYVANLINSGGTLFITWTFPQNENDKKNSPFHLDKYYQWGLKEISEILISVGFTRQTDSLWRKI
jgi:ubiquinone/menaquinone biosynthesis C-methylase UbiE